MQEEGPSAQDQDELNEEALERKLIDIMEEHD